jgi:copper(I)-binding protein
VISRRAVLAGLLLPLAGCVHYPTVDDVGGTRIRTEKGRAVREAGRALVYCDVVSTGKFGDAITGVFTPVAKAQLVDGADASLPRLEIPGVTTVKFAPGGPHVVLTDLARPLTPGETFIVTLMFEKSGGIGVITVVE